MRTEDRERWCRDDLAGIRRKYQRCMGFTRRNARPGREGTRAGRPDVGSPIAALYDAPTRVPPTTALCQRRSRIHGFDRAGGLAAAGQAAGARGWTASQWAVVATPPGHRHPGFRRASDRGAENAAWIAVAKIALASIALANCWTAHPASSGNDPTRFCAGAIGGGGTGLAASWPRDRCGGAAASPRATRAWGPLVRPARGRRTVRRERVISPAGLADDRAAVLRRALAHSAETVAMTKISARLVGHKIADLAIYSRRPWTVSAFDPNPSRAPSGGLRRDGGVFFGRDGQ